MSDFPSANIEIVPESFAVRCTQCGTVGHGYASRDTAQKMADVHREAEHPHRRRPQPRIVQGPQ